MESMWGQILLQPISWGALAKGSSGVTPAAGGQSKAEAGRLVICTARGETNSQPRALAEGSVRLQNSTKGCGKLLGFAARNRLTSFHPKAKNFASFFFFNRS